MAVLGVITCETLEQEIAYLLANDHDIERVTVLENDISRRLIQALESRGAQDIRQIPHISSFRPEISKHMEVFVRVLNLSLHGRKNSLRRAVASAASEMAGYVHSLFLGYGLCGNAFDDMKKLLNISIPVFIPMDNDQPVDDCVGLLLGGRDCYYAEQKKEAGTFFMTPGWTCHWKKIFNTDFCGTAPGMLTRIFDGYNRSLLIVTPVMEEEEMRREVAEFNKTFGLRIETRKGTMKILERTWKSAKAPLRTGHRRKV